MKRKKKISVRAEHIRRGKQNSTKFCPIALAMKDAGYKYARVSNLHCTWWDKKGPRSASLPFDARAFIFRFDSSHSFLPLDLKFRPFSFEISA